MSEKYQRFTPGEYLPFEAPLVEQKKKDQLLWQAKVNQEFVVELKVICT